MVVHKSDRLLGDPIAKDATFFFVSMDAFREERSSTLFGTYPTEAMQRDYDFSELDLTVADLLSGDPFPNNRIPQTRVLHVFSSYIPEFVPLPNRPGLASNFVTPGNSTNQVDQWIARVDHQFSEKFSLMGRYVINDIDDAPPRINKKFLRTQRARNQGVVLHGTLTASATTVVDYQGGWNLFAQDVFKALGNTSPDIASEVMGIKGLATDPRRLWFFSDFARPASTIASGPDLACLAVATQHSPRRQVITTPLKQLFVLNSGWMQARGRSLAAMVDAIEDRKARIDALYRRTLSRDPTSRETGLAVGFLDERRGRIGRDPWDEYAHSLLATNELTYRN